MADIKEYFIDGTKPNEKYKVFIVYDDTTLKITSISMEGYGVVNIKWAKGLLNKSFAKKTDILNGEIVLSGGEEIDVSSYEFYLENKKDESGESSVSFPVPILIRHKGVA